MTPLELEIITLLHYNAATGIFTYKEPRRRITVGQQAGGVTGQGYVEIKLLGKKVAAHRIAWWLSFGEWPDIIDHKNKVRRDNRLHNLRNTGQLGNSGNSSQLNIVPGIHKANGLWIATCQKKRLGSFTQLADAVDARIHYLQSINSHYSLLPLY